MIQYSDQIVPTEDQLLKLYSSVGWTDYTNDPGKLRSAVKNSFVNVSAWDGSTLVGMVRAIGDGVSILYLQDVLVMKKYQRQGIGRTLMQMMVNQYADVRQKVLLTEDQPQTRKFYESCGFHSADRGNVVAFYQFNS